MHMHSERRSRAQYSLQSTHSIQTGTFDKGLGLLLTQFTKPAILLATLFGRGPCACMILFCFLVTSTSLCSHTSPPAAIGSIIFFSLCLVSG